MVWILYLLCLFGLLGCVDILYFHLYRYRLFQSPSSRGEEWTHLLRLAVFPVIIFWVLFVKAGGWAAGGLLALLTFDFLNSLADAYLEPKSREPLGGLPRGEYVLHAVLMAVNGAILALAFQECSGLLNQPYSLKLETLAVPRWVGMLGFQLAVGSLVLLMVESWGFIRSFFKTR